ncbi:MAG: hypothetical protein K2N78_01075 [Oscillospiraceae bacterium]|nr:hypothetical protein [Oscillospiraceae bacterium]
MSKSFSKSIKAGWRRALSSLLVLLTVLGMFPSTALAAEPSPAYAATGNFELNIAGATGWNSTIYPLPVYDIEADGVEIAAVPAIDDEAGPVAFVILEDNGGDRVKIGLACDDSGSLTSWEGGRVTKTGWADKEYIFVNLPDVLPSIAYTALPAEQFSSRLGRYEFIVPCWYTLAEQLAEAQKDAMSNGETLLIHDAGNQTADISVAKGDPAELHTYEVDGAVYQKYEVWTGAGSSRELAEWAGPFSVSSSSTIDRVFSTTPYKTFTEVYVRSGIRRAPIARASASPTGGTGGLNPGSPGGQKPTRNDVSWTTDQERTFLRFTLIEFPEGVVTDLNNMDYNTWHVVGHPLNVVWGKGSHETCR